MELHKSRMVHFAYCLAADYFGEYSSDINHAREVAQILATISEDEELVAAGMLHDIIEDTKITYEDLLRHKEFSKRVADLVNEVTHEGQKDEHGYYFPRLHSREGIMIKYADHLSNLNRITEWDKKRQEHFLKHSKFWRTE